MIPIKLVTGFFDLHSGQGRDDSQIPQSEKGLDISFFMGQ